MPPRPGIGSSFEDFAYVQSCECDASERIRTMLDEEQQFVCGDYVTNVQKDGMDRSWRRQITEWCFQVADYYNYSRETAALSVSILDRYLSTTSTQRMEYQLASLCSLFLAVKYCEGTPPRVATFIALAADRFIPSTLVTMEQSMLDRLGWRINQPTATSFVRALLTYLSASHDAMHQILQQVQYLVELASCDYFFVTQRPSTVAFSAILYTLGQRDKFVLKDADREAWVDTVQDKFGLDGSNSEVIACQEKLGQIHAAVQKGSSGSGSSTSKATGRQSPISQEQEEEQNANAMDGNNASRRPSPTGVDEVTDKLSNLEPKGNESEGGGDLPSPNDRPRKRQRETGRFG